MRGSTRRPIRFSRPTRLWVFQARRCSPASASWRVTARANVASRAWEGILLAAQVDHFGDVKNLLAGLSRAVSTNPARTTLSATRMSRLEEARTRSESTENLAAASQQSVCAIKSDLAGKLDKFQP